MNGNLSLHLAVYRVLIGAAFVLILAGLILGAYSQFGANREIAESLFMMILRLSLFGGGVSFLALCRIEALAIRLKKNPCRCREEKEVSE